jgi:hypothetical protein
MIATGREKSTLAGRVRTIQKSKCWRLASPDFAEYLEISGGKMLFDCDLDRSHYFLLE